MSEIANDRYATMLSIFTLQFPNPNANPSPISYPNHKPNSRDNNAAPE